MKEFEGKEVYLRPTGNNWRRTGGRIQYEKGFIVKVARVNATFTLGNSEYESKHKFRGNELHSDCNSGYVVYGSEQDVLDYFESDKLADRIFEYCRYGCDLKSIGLGKLKSVAAILNINTED